MSLALSLAPQSHVFSDYPYERSNSLASSSTGTVRYYGCRQASNESCPSEATLQLDQLQQPREGISGPRASRSSIQLSKHVERPLLRKAITQGPPNRGWFAGEPKIYPSILSLSAESFHSVPLDEEVDPELFDNEEGVRDALDSLPTTPDCVTAVPVSFDSGPSINQEEESTAAASQPFKHWLSMLRRKNRHEDPIASTYQRLGSGSDEEKDGSDFPPSKVTSGKHKKSMSQISSSAFVSAVRSATMTIADTTIGSRSWVTGMFGPLRGNGTPRSARASQESSPSNMEAVMDEKAWHRAIQRKKILEELIASEESYVADLKVLINVYFTLLTSVFALSSNTRELVRENVTTILQMHESLLSELHDIVPESDSDQCPGKETTTLHRKGHIRWHSADGTSTRPRMPRVGRRMRYSLDLSRPLRQFSIGSMADPKTASAVALVFQRFIGQLFAYEEYGAKYELMVRDLAATYKNIPTGQAFEKGIEVLSRTLESINTRSECTKKGMTFADLLIKPIQRVCKYPLLFADLCKHTPVIDDPEAHEELEKILFRLKEATHEINKATGDPKTRDLIEKTWLLQDRLRFPCQAPSSVITRMLGHVELCGVLHVTYQTASGIRGQYMLCALFKTCLVLAIGEKGLSSFTVAASIPLVNVSIEDADNGRGLQCHTVPFSWKLIFELDHRLFEVILSACSPSEEGQWRKHLNERSCIESLHPIANQTATRDFCSLLELDIKSIGTLYGQPHSLARRISIHRAATVGPKSQLSQVMIRNTYSVDQISRNPSESSLSLNRSQSMVSSGRIQVLTPRRSERVGLELALSDVWTKDILPYPGMKQNENPFRASANHVMRKLSMASITSTLSRRTSSLVGFNKPEPRPPTPMDFGRYFNRSQGPNACPNRAAPRPAAPRAMTSPPSKTVDFHNTPEKFLPPDFELKVPRLPKPPHTKPTVRAVSDERSTSTMVNSARPTVIESTGKLRRSVTAHAAPRSQAEVSKPSLSSAKSETKENVKQNAGLLQPAIARENLPIAPKPLKPISKQLRRLFN